MTFYFILTATESSIFEVSTPSAEGIRASLSHVQVSGASWVGPGPRITRRTAVGDLWGYLTTLAAVLAVEASTPQQAQAIAQQAAQQADNALRGVSNDWVGVSVAPYSEAVNGPLSWWQSGQATLTHTRDEFLTGTARLSAYDNPVGPDSAAVRPPTPGEVLGDLTGEVTNRASQPIQNVSNALLVAGLVAGGGAALYLAWPLLTGARSAVARATAKTNPRRYRRT